MVWSGLSIFFIVFGIFSCCVVVSLCGFTDLGGIRDRSCLTSARLPCIRCGRDGRKGGTLRCRLFRCRGTACEVVDADGANFYWIFYYKFGNSLKIFWQQAIRLPASDPFPFMDQFILQNTKNYDSGLNFLHLAQSEPDFFPQFQMGKQEKLSYKACQATWDNRKLF